MEGLGAVGRRVSALDIEELPALVLGGATLMRSYNDDPYAVPTLELVRRALGAGMCAIDTSPYYGDSEAIYGEALEAVRAEHPRETYFICTKVGREGLSEFDYSAAHVRASVQRSCARLRTEYLDLVYLHDVEFVGYAGIWEALRELRRLKDEGVIRFFGISGYPVELLQHVSERACARADVGPLDAVLSYCQLNLQSMRLLEQAERLFKQSRVRVVGNASIVGMMLLRSGGPREGHPASAALRRCAAEAAEYCAARGVELADLATRYSIAQWRGRGPTVLGVSTVDELERALANYQLVVKQGGLSAEDSALVEHIQTRIFGEHLNENWASGIPHAIPEPAED
ncbi:AaceriABR094Wp [[Ashbya] aceris (nom. inval.)]|nr:AaceriABR094Wp [[Ashbya] aceris (nom. inval.)]